MSEGPFFTSLPLTWLVLVMSMAAVRLELAREEEEALNHNTTVSLHDVCSASVLISTGLELEDQQ